MNEVHGTPTHEDIAIAAYYIWQRRVWHELIHDHQVEVEPDHDWYRAEHELRHRAWHYGKEPL